MAPDCSLPFYEVQHQEARAAGPLPSSEGLTGEARQLPQDLGIERNAIVTRASCCAT